MKELFIEGVKSVIEYNVELETIDRVLSVIELSVLDVVEFSFEETVKLSFLEKVSVELDVLDGDVSISEVTVELYGI